MAVDEEMRAFVEEAIANLDTFPDSELRVYEGEIGAGGA